MTLMSQPLTINYQLDDPKDGVKNIGLILLSTDLTLERDLLRLMPMDKVSTYINRVTYNNPMTVENLAAMEKELVQAARDIIPGASLDCLAFACTSGAIAIGPGNVLQRLEEGQPGVPATTPISAVVDACCHLDISKIALLTPYYDEVNQPLSRYLQDNGIEVLTMSTFDMASDIDVARIPVSAIMEAAREADHPEAEALFMSCTALRSLECIQALEDELGKPVLGSNQVMLWRTLRLAGVDEEIEGFGRLLQS